MSRLWCFPLVGALSCADDVVTREHEVPGGTASRGAIAIAHYGCGSCHVIPGILMATGRAGPPLTDLAERTFVAGKRRNEPVGLMEWIRNPQQVSPGTAMPALGVTEQDARDIVAYLYTLQSDRRGPPRLIPSRVLAHD